MLRAGLGDTCPMFLRSESTGNSRLDDGYAANWFTQFGSHSRMMTIRRIRLKDYSIRRGGSPSRGLLDPEEPPPQMAKILHFLTVFPQSYLLCRGNLMGL